MTHSNKLCLGIIPARGGSRRVVRKNIRTLVDKPLIAYSIVFALNETAIDEVVVTTDDDEIAEVSQNWGAQVIKRPDYLATDDALTIDTVNHTLDYVGRNIDRQFTEIILLQPTCPFRRPRLADDAISILRQTNCHSVISYYKMDYNHPNRAKRLDSNDNVSPYCEEELYNIGRDQLPAAYYRDGSLYACQAGVPKSFGNLMGTDQKGIVVDIETAINIDTERDWLLAEHFADNYINSDIKTE